MGCGGSRAPQPQAETSVTGLVRLAGSTPALQVLVEPENRSETALEVSGEYRGELQRLSGAKVRVSGILASGNQLNVTEYEILEISGQEPVVGVLELRGAAVHVRPLKGASVEIREAPRELLENAGAKVWVILDSSGAVKGYGILREE